MSHLYCCNSPRLLAPSTWAKLNRAPLYSAITLFGGSEVEVRGSVAPKAQTTSAKNADNGELRLGGLHRGHNGAWPRVELAREPAMWSVGGAAQAHNSVPTCE